jgi:hypothetical protein
MTGNNIDSIENPLAIASTDRLFALYKQQCDAETFAYKARDFAFFEEVSEAADRTLAELRARGEWQ